MTANSRLVVEGWGVATARLERSWLGREPAATGWVFRSPSAWTLVSLAEDVVYGDDERPVSGRAAVVVDTFATMAELAAFVDDAYTGGAWVALLDAGQENDPELYEAWVPEQVRRDFEKASIYDKSLEMGGSGRQAPGWREAAAALTAEQLQQAGYEVLDDTPVVHLEDGGSRFLGALRVTRYGWEGVGVVRVDDAGEVFVRVPDASEVDGPLWRPTSDHPPEDEVVEDKVVGPTITDELAERRRLRAALRQDRTPAVVVLPHTEGELARALGDLYEILLGANFDGPAEGAGNVDALEAVGRLSRYVGSVERAEPALQPVAPDGRYELVPLHTVLVDPVDLAGIVGAAVAVVAASQGQGDHALAAVVNEWREDGRRDPAAPIAALAELLRLEPDDDAAAVHAWLAEASERGAQRLVLDEAQMAAYDRVCRRILATWHAGDPLAPFLYRGDKPG